ncbi:MAG: hypothetical protein J5711_04395 [Bacteroidales bacterium]|nr:hypothetical protein [Bacteroidales bacterium]
MNKTKLIKAIEDYRKGKGSGKTRKTVEEYFIKLADQHDGNWEVPDGMPCKSYLPWFGETHADHWVDEGTPLSIIHLGESALIEIDGWSTAIDELDDEVEMPALISILEALIRLYNIEF